MSNVELELNALLREKVRRLESLERGICPTCGNDRATKEWRRMAREEVIAAGSEGPGAFRCYMGSVVRHCSGCGEETITNNVWLSPFNQKWWDSRVKCPACKGHGMVGCRTCHGCGTVPDPNRPELNDPWYEVIWSYEEAGIKGNSAGEPVA